MVQQRQEPCTNWDSTGPSHQHPRTPTLLHKMVEVCRARMLAPRRTKVTDTEVNSKVCQVQTGRYHSLFAHRVTYQETGRVKVSATTLADLNLIPGLTRWKKRTISHKLSSGCHTALEQHPGTHYKCKICPSAALAWRCMPVIPDRGRGIMSARST